MKNILILLWFVSSICFGQTNNFNILDNTSATISGGSINNTSVGRTTPATGAFTTLSATGQVMLGGSASLTLSTGAIGMSKMTASASAPGAGGAKFEVVCGTNAGTAKLIIYAGTSTTAVTIVDNIGTGVTGC